jgi:hypothetical protein
VAHIGCITGEWGDYIAGRALSGGRRERLPATSSMYTRGAIVSPELILVVAITVGIVARLTWFNTALIAPEAGGLQAAPRPHRRPHVRHQAGAGRESAC